MSFFSASTMNSGRRPLPLAAKCGECGLFRQGCMTPKMPPAGRNRKKILVVGEVPSEEADAKGTPFHGTERRRLQQAMRGVDLDRDCLTTNALICRPPGGRGKKDERAVEFCRPNAVAAFKTSDAAVVVLLGERAVRSFVGWLWKEEVKGVPRWAGRAIPSRQLNAWVCPTYSPAYVLEQDNPVVSRLFDRHIGAACRLAEKGRPYPDGPPDWRKDVKLVYSGAGAARLIERMRKAGRPVAWDIETNMLKPDDSRREVVCASVSDGKRTAAFPWSAKAAEALAVLLADPKVPKIGYNLKFEDRWARAMGWEVNNWAWDGMLAAHALDNRRGTKSLKFQAFVNFGLPEYDAHVHKYLEGEEDGGYSPNRIDQVATDDLLLYCGMDSLLEWKTWRLQRSKFEDDDGR